MPTYKHPALAELVERTAGTMGDARSYMPDFKAGILAYFEGQPQPAPDAVTPAFSRGWLDAHDLRGLLGGQMSDFLEAKPNPNAKNGYARCSADTRSLRESKEDLYRDGFPVDQARSLVDRLFVAESFEHLRGRANLAFLVAPSTSGQNILPTLIAQKLQATFGGQVIDLWATPNSTTRTASQSGIEKLRHPPSYTVERDQLAGIGRNATLVLVDDVVTTGGSIRAMRDALAREGLHADHVASLAQSDMRLVRDADIDRITRKLGSPELRADIATVLDGRLKHFANYLEVSIRKSDPERNNEIIRYFQSEAQRLRETGLSHDGPAHGAPDLRSSLESAQSTRGGAAGLDSRVSPQGRDVHAGDDVARGGPALSPVTKVLLDRLDALRVDFADHGRKSALQSAQDTAAGIAGPDLTRIPLQVAALDFVKGNLSRSDLERFAAKHDAAPRHSRSQAREDFGHSHA